MKRPASPLVVKLGGSIFDSRDTTLADLVAEQKQGDRLVVIHGGGEMATQWLTRLGITTSFVDGLRVTDAETLKVVTAVLAGLANKDIVTCIQQLGGSAVGLSGADGSLLVARIADPRLGYTGEIVKVNPKPVNSLLAAGFMPVIAPLSYFPETRDVRLLNINGDTAAAEIAIAVKARVLVFLTDVDGIHDATGERIPRLTLDEAKKLLASSAISGGMIPKLKAAIRALAGVPVVRVVNGKAPHAMVEAASEDGGGTTLVRG